MDDGNLFPPAASQPGAIKRKALWAYESPIPTSFGRHLHTRITEPSSMLKAMFNQRGYGFHCFIVSGHE